MSNLTLAFKIGIARFWGTDNSVVLLSGGEPVFAAEHERYTRKKHGTTTFPASAIQDTLHRSGHSLDEIDQIVVGYEPPLETDRFCNRIRRVPGSGTGVQSKLYLAKSITDHFRQFRFNVRNRIQSQFERFEGETPPIEFKNHHRSHAASAFYPSGFDEALVLAVDFVGENHSTTVWHGTPTGLERIRAHDFPNSLGFFYSLVTEYLGYNALNGEGKVMGLAAYGDENSEIEAALRSLVTTGADYDVTPLTEEIRIDPGVRALEDALGRPAKDDPSSFSKWDRDLAYVTQKLLEESVLSIVDRYVDGVETNNVCLAGGVAMNCKMNKLIREHDKVRKLFVQPVANDAGIALGAGMLEYEPATVPEQSTVYLGPSYTTDKIVGFLEQNRIPYTEPEDTAVATARALADGKLVGRFAGRMELGPRALGNRSILADPRTIDSRDRVNEFVKHRENWRPFAPSIKADEADRYLVDECDAPFMIQTFDVRAEKQDEIPAVLHPGDKTTRPQTVTPKQNPAYYELLDEFEAISGVPVLLNTSFNDHGEPIVRTPRQAVRDFFSMGLDVLVLEDVLVEKGRLGSETLSGQRTLTSEGQ